MDKISKNQIGIFRFLWKKNDREYRKKTRTLQSFNKVGFFRFVVISSLLLLLLLLVFLDLCVAGNVEPSKKNRFKSLYFFLHSSPDSQKYWNIFFNLNFSCCQFWFFFFLFISFQHELEGMFIHHSFVTEIWFSIFKTNK